MTNECQKLINEVYVVLKRVLKKNNVLSGISDQVLKSPNDQLMFILFILKTFTTRYFNHVFLMRVVKC